MKTGIEQIAAERKRQIEKEGWDAGHDDAHDEGELALAACCYASPKDLFVHEMRDVQLNSSRGVGDCYSYDFAAVEDYYDPWPWSGEYDKKHDHDRLKQLVIAGALVAAEIDRIQRRK